MSCTRAPVLFIQAFKRSQKCQTAECEFLNGTYYEIIHANEFINYMEGTAHIGSLLKNFVIKNEKCIYSKMKSNYGSSK